MTPDEVLTVLTDMWRQPVAIDPAEPIEIPLTRDTNVEEAANLLGVAKLNDDWPTIANFLKDWFRVQIAADEWERVLHPKTTRTLGPVCDLIAKHALAPVIERQVNGVQLNWQAAAFRAILLILNESGMSIKGIRPETKLAAYIHVRPDVFIHHVSRLAPGRMPALTTTNYAWHVLLAIAVAAISYVSLQWLFPGIRWPRLDRFGPIVGMVALFAVLGLWSWKRMVRRRLGDLVTFRDLAYALTSPPGDYPDAVCGDDGEVIRWSTKYFPAASSSPERQWS